MFRVGIIFQDGSIGSKTVKTKEEAEDYILQQSEKKEIKRADIINKENEERERIF